MNTLDALIVAALVIGGVGGYRLGLLTRASSWLGMLLGVLIAARFLPGLLARTGDGTDRPGLAFGGLILLVGGALFGQALGLVVGSHLQIALRTPGARALDASGGAVAGVVGVLLAVWILVPTMADVNGWPAHQARRSTLARAVVNHFPSPPDATNTLRRLFGDQYPRVFDSMRPAPAVGPPPQASGFTDATAARVERSTVKVIGVACDRIQEGSGFVVRPGIVLTNAHVVAGEDNTEVERSDGSHVPAKVIGFDPKRDVAVLSTPAIDRIPLPVGSSDLGQSGAAFGHPGGGPLERSPFKTAQRINAVGTDIYGRSGTSRDVLVLASELKPGDSGAALVTPAGTVVGLAFAVAPDRPGVAYALSTTEMRAALAQAGREPVKTGPCVA